MLSLIDGAGDVIASLLGVCDRARNGEWSEWRDGEREPKVKSAPVCLAPQNVSRMDGIHM